MPVVQEGLPVPGRDGGHGHGLGVPLVLEERRQVLLTDLPEMHVHGYCSRR